jgi:hypothetical protein
MRRFRPRLRPARAARGRGRPVTRDLSTHRFGDTRMNRRFLPPAAVCLAALTLGASPVLAQVDLSGVWQPRYHEDQPERIPGPELRDYLGLPINEAARQYADSWDPSRITLPEEQCRVHVSPYILRGPLNLRIWQEKHPKTQDLQAIKMYSSTYEQTRTIWMDGRPHPGPNAPHTWMGFSTGRWDGDMLVIETTHIKHGWIRRNGVPQSDKAKMTEYIVRNGEIMSHIFVLVDPIYLAEPLVKSQEFARSVRELPAQTWLWVCEPVVEIATQTEGDVPAYLPGEHPFKYEFADRHRIPHSAVEGGPETMYPEYQAKVKAELAKMPPQTQKPAQVPGPATPKPAAPGGGR